MPSAASKLIAMIVTSLITCTKIKAQHMPKNYNSLKIS